MGIVSGIIDKLGICEYIDRLIPKKRSHLFFGETPDAIAREGPTELFTGIILEILDNLLQGVLRLHYD